MDIQELYHIARDFEILHNDIHCPMPGCDHPFSSVKNGLDVLDFITLHFRKHMSNDT